MDKRVKREQPRKMFRFVQDNAVNWNFGFKFSDEQCQQFNQKRRAKQEEKKEQKAPKARKIGEIWVYSKHGSVQLFCEDFTSYAIKSLTMLRNMIIMKSLLGILKFQLFSLC